jgi:hypothetical protein
LDIPDSNISSAGAELNVFKHYGHRKVFPSSTGPQMALASKASDSLFLKRLAAKAENEREESDKGVSSNRSRKLKKVTFRLPEEADFIIIYSPEPEETFNDQESK